MSDTSRVEEIFLTAVGRSDATDRAAYLDEACGADVSLRRRVEELLAAHPKIGNFLESSPNDRTRPYTPSTADDSRTAAGTLVAGRYKLLERIGEGGMGDVWMADQQEPVKRRVAVKLIKAGMDSRGVLARFEAERQALAVMDHPNIAKVLDAGTTAEGRPFFVMELVKGTPITEFCDARRLAPQQRLELFVPVCQAIQHAHQKGIIHRDIKPTNVLVALHDDTPVPKVIDFGVAKAVGQQLTEKTLFTGYGTLVGTPAYMAPEQATFNQLDVDTRADVYALGVLLYELLAGSPPVESERLKKAALDEVLRLVREEEPPRPSQRLSTSQTKASIAAVRGSDPAKLSALMRGELDWIVMKALEKDRSRRYDTATSLAKDVQRYLNGDAVEACPPTLGYRLRKMYRRNRAAVLVGLTFTLMLLSGVAVAAVLAMQARRAEMVARASEQEAQEQRREAEDNKNAWLKTSDAYMVAAMEAEIRNNSARLDADLLEYKADPRVGLLRLARPLKDQLTIPTIGPNFDGAKDISLKGPEFAQLREFQAAAVIAAGQEFVPLVPSFGAGDVNQSSPDGRLLLAGFERTGIKLVAIPSQKHIGVLREGSERLVKWGFTPAGKTIYTQDTDSILRFWNTDGTFRAKTPLRPERFVYPAGMTQDEVRRVADRANNIIVTDDIAVVRSLPPVRDKTGKQPDDWYGTQTQVPGPTETYSTLTGQFIRRLDRPGWMISDFQRAANGRWLIYKDDRYDKATQRRDIEFVVVSPADGRELARLDHPGTEPFLKVHVSPSGKWAISHRHTGSGHPESRVSRNVLLWRSQDWKPVQDSVLTDAIAAVKGFQDLSFVTDDLVSVWSDKGFDTTCEGLIRIGKPGSWTSGTALAFRDMFWVAPVAELGGTLLRNERVLLTADPIQRLNVPRGRKYHPDLAKIAPDGRFFENLDTVTEKELIYEDKTDPLPPLTYISGFGRTTVYYDAVVEWVLRILPDPTKLTIPPEMLELWAQVVTGGELSTDGRFQAWDEPTWQAKQKLLAAMKPPYADFPFPGWAATEPHLWYRIRASMTQNGTEREKLRNEWQRRSGRLQPKSEPDPWRTPGPMKDIGPSPRPVK